MTPLEMPGSPDDRDAWMTFLVERCDDLLEEVRRTAAALAVPVGEAGHRADVLRIWGGLSTALLNATTAARLLGQAHPDAVVRERADAAEQQASTLAQEVRLDRGIYETLAALDTDGLDEATVRMLRMTLRDFRRAGVDLDDETRTRLRDLAERDTALAQTFERTVSSDVRTVRVRPDQLDGLPRDFVEAHPPGPDGMVTLTTDYPDALPFRELATDRDARHALIREFYDRGYPENDAVLGEILAVRRERARLLGYPGWPDYDAEIRMIGSEAAVRDFVDALVEESAEASARALSDLVDRQRKDHPDLTGLGWADAWYYAQVLRRERFGVDAQEMRRYFDFEKVRAGVLDLTSRLFGLEYVKRCDAPAWHSDVATYDVLLDGDPLGRIHLDLHPREGKFKHAAHFPLVKGIRGVQPPQSALLCNLPRGLMSHGDVLTLLHEFGHLIHALVGGRQDWARFSGVATERDFIEAPSMMLEEWAWDPRTLATFATDAEGRPIPEDLVLRLRDARKFNLANEERVQMFYSAISVGIHADVPGDLAAYVEGLAARYLPYDPIPDTHHYASFGHLADEGYGSSYYTYLWSLVIAQDLFSAFDPEDLLAPDVARRYRDTVLAPGGSRDAADLVEAFLGRPTDTRAFDAWLAR